MLGENVQTFYNNRIQNYLAIEIAQSSTTVVEKYYVALNMQNDREKTKCCMVSCLQKHGSLLRVDPTKFFDKDI